MATIFLKATSDVELSPPDGPSSGLQYRPLGDGPPAYPLLQTDVATKGVDTAYNPYVVVRVGTASMPPASAIASVQVVADYTVHGGGGVVYLDAAVSINTDGERHYSYLAGMFLTFGENNGVTDPETPKYMTEYTPDGTPPLTTITDVATFPSGASNFRSVRFYVTGSYDMFLASSNDTGVAAKVWELNPCPVVKFSLPNHGGHTYSVINAMIQFQDNLYVCASDDTDLFWAVFKYTGAAVSWVRDLSSGHASGVCVFDEPNPANSLLLVFNGTKVETMTAAFAWTAPTTGITGINRNTVVTYLDPVALTNSAYFATYRSGPSHVPNIYQWDGAALTTYAPSTTGVVDDDLVVVLSIGSFKGGLVFMSGQKLETWGDDWFDFLYYGTYWSNNPGIPFAWSQVQTFTAPGGVGYAQSPNTCPMAVYSDTSTMQFAINDYFNNSTLIYQNATNPFGLFSLLDTDTSNYGMPIAFETRPSHSYADATGNISWSLATVPCTGAAWTSTNVTAVESVGFHLEFYVGDYLILNRLGLLVTYTPIDNVPKGCLGFLVS